MWSILYGRVIRGTVYYLVCVVYRMHCCWKENQSQNMENHVFGTDEFEYLHIHCSNTWKV
jgi:hypothetical protein